MKPGETVAGKYRIERVLGEGGMGIVFEATHLQLEQRVALKVLHGDALQSEEALNRFAREARAAAKIQSEHVVKVFDVASLDSGAPLLVMEYLEGRDLDAQLRQSGPLAVEDAVTYVLQACEALAEAHANGIVHRDLKPANLFVGERTDGSLGVKILDFGISKLIPKGGGDVSVTRTSALMGSPLYMAPEQMRSTRNVDLRADVWSLGIILHELLAGRPPFDGETLTEVCAAIVADAPRSLAERRPDAPAELEAAILRCLEKDPAQRFQDVLELARHLKAFAPEQGAISLKRITRVLRKADAANTTVPNASGSFTAPAAASLPPAREALGDSDAPVARATGPSGTAFIDTGAGDAKDTDATAATFGRTGSVPARSRTKLLLAGGAVLGLALALTVGVALSGNRNASGDASGAGMLSAEPTASATASGPTNAATAPPEAEITAAPATSTPPAASTAPSTTAATSSAALDTTASATTGGATAQKPSTKPRGTARPSSTSAPASTHGFGGRN